MAINILVIKETADEEKRVSASPDTVKKLINLGCEVVIEKNAGEASSYTNKSYENAGASIKSLTDAIIKKADILLSVQSPDEKTISKLKKNSITINILSPYDNENTIKSLASSSITSIAMDMVPRISRAQAMDVLSSQANLSGYKSVLDATEHYGRAFPMMMTAAGTIPPAKIFIMGAGVAGLQAIATAKRLGAIVSATDVRPAAKEQVQSLGATFIAVEDDEFKEAETSGGYAKEMSKEYQQKQADLIAKTVAKQDIVITTALIPGRPAPKLIDENMVKSMKSGSLIIDMAAPAGGNCTLSECGKIVKKHGATIIAHKNIPSRLPESSSALYAKNILNLLNLIIDKEANISLNFEDEIVKGVTITHEGKIVHPNFIKLNDKKEEKPKNTTKKSLTKKGDK